MTERVIVTVIDGRSIELSRGNFAAAGLVRRVRRPRTTCVAVIHWFAWNLPDCMGRLAKCGGDPRGPRFLCDVVVASCATPAPFRMELAVACSGRLLPELCAPVLPGPELPGPASG